MVQLNHALFADPQKLRRLYWQFIALAETYPAIRSEVAGAFEVDGQRYTIPRFTFRGPSVGGQLLRIGLFSLIHGDEPAGAVALEQFLLHIAQNPGLATGYELVFYPICNPTAYEDGTRHNRAGFDLNREFWRDSELPEIRILEAELRRERFDGLIALHADDTCEGNYGYSHGRALDDSLLRPALLAADRVLARDARATIDGFAAHEGVICDCFPGILAPAAADAGRAFNLIFETPAHAPLSTQVAANVAALHAILATYRGFISYAQNL